ncbi:MAG: hypothetical protein HQ570_02830 [Candidatus Omnitrophica bacterium]|nr:hypothetical protein [Candidatus Omnitrophota bacterium]
MKAIALFSGGLDSTLAIKIITEQGVDVVALNFFTPFCCCERSKGCGSLIKEMADQLGVKLKMVYLGQEYLDMIKNPDHGYGKNLNPCIDCRIFKFKRAKEVMLEEGASFVITGEVLGQRPMSQHRQALRTIERETGLEGLVLRPLSAKLFSPTLAEEQGWVKREDLLNISGRTRKPQIRLASNWGIKNYPCPAGGCLLTDSNFCQRLKDLLKHEEVNINNAELLKLGRHFRLGPKFKLIVGRDEKENQKILNLAQQGDFCFESRDLPGPTGIGRGQLDESIKILSAQIIARYTSQEEKVDVLVKTISQPQQEVLSVKAIGEEKIKKYMIL